MSKKNFSIELRSTARIRTHSVELRSVLIERIIKINPSASSYSRFAAHLGAVNPGRERMENSSPARKTIA